MVLSAFWAFESSIRRGKWLHEFAEKSLLNTFSKSKRVSYLTWGNETFWHFGKKNHKNLLNFAIFWFVFEGTWDHAWHFFAICDIIVIFCTGTKDNLEMVVFFRNVLIVSIWHCCVIRALLITFGSHTMWLDNRKTTSERISNGLKTF